MAHLESHPLYPGEGSRIFIAAGVLKLPSHLEPFYRIDDPLAAPLLTIGSEVMPVWLGNAGNNGGEDFVYDSDLKAAGNCRGLPGEGVDGLKAFKEPVRILSELGIRTAFSISNLPHETPIDVIPELAARVVEDVNPTAIEVNLSCPNGLTKDGSFHPPTCTDPEVSKELIVATRIAVGPETCLGVKDSPHVTGLDERPNELEIRELSSAITPYIDFVTGINTIGNQEFPALTAGNGRGGMSGPIVADIAKQWLRTWAYYTPSRVALLSCGGVEEANIASEFSARRKLGAMLVGGAQEFYRTAHRDQLVAQWAIAAS